MEGLFLVLHGTGPGAGKTTVAEEVASMLRRRGLQVGGFTLVPVYRAGPGGFRVVGYEARLQRTGRVVPIAHDRMEAWEAVDPGEYRSVDSRSTRFFVDPEATRQLIEGARAEAKSPGVDAMVIDEVGPVLTLTKKRRNRRGEAFPLLVREMLDHPKACSLVTFSDPRMQARDFQACRQLVVAGAHAQQYRPRQEVRYMEVGAHAAPPHAVAGIIAEASIHRKVS